MRQQIYLFCSFEVREFGQVVKGAALLITPPFYCEFEPHKGVLHFHDFSSNFDKL